LLLVLVEPECRTLLRAATRDIRAGRSRPAQRPRVVVPAVDAASLLAADIETLSALAISPPS
jgi:hypothetical protein